MTKHKNHNVILQGKDATGKRFVSLHGEKYRIHKILSMTKMQCLIGVESIIDEAKTVINIERDTNFKVKFR